MADASFPESRFSHPCGYSQQHQPHADFCGAATVAILARRPLVLCTEYHTQEEESCRKSLGTGDGREGSKFYLQCKSIGIATMAELAAAPRAPVAPVGHSEDRAVFTHPCAWGAQEEQDQCSCHEEFHLSCSASAEGELVFGLGNLYPSKAACLFLPVCWQTPLEQWFPPRH